MSLGQNIRLRRYEAGLTQRELAERINVSQAALNMFENDRRQPAFSTGLRIAEVLGCRPEDLYEIPIDKHRRKDG